MLTIEYANRPEYANADGTCVLLMVKFEEFAEVLPFGATPNDPMPYGVELYNNALAGMYGPIAPYVPPPEPEQPITQGAQTL